MRSAIGFLHSTRAEGATVLVVTGIDLKRSGVSACRIQISALGLLPEGFPHLTRAVGVVMGSRFAHIRRVRLSHSK
eukprot:951274-Pyramimonas_sp.AAC.1